MADIDTKVLYLETPPTSAPKTSYILGVRIRNTGIHARVASGYVQVFDKDTGMLVKTYPVASAEIDPGEEKQAFAAEAWDLTDELVGKQFILAGMVTCDGDMIPENDILHPTTVTVAETPPEPPPAVTPHKNQHEDGGNDELDVTALHGVLHDDQPPAAHGSIKHDDTVPTLVDGLVPVEQLPDMPVAEHGSLDHDDSVEATERKDQPGGYPGLDTTGLIALDHLALNPDPAKFLRGDGTWADGTAPPYGTPVHIEGGGISWNGILDTAARADHHHGGEGGLEAGFLRGPWEPPGPHELLGFTVQSGCIWDNERFAIMVDGCFSYTSGIGVNPTVDIELYGGNPGGFLQRSLLSFPLVASGVSDKAIRFKFLTSFELDNSYCWAEGSDHGTAPFATPAATPPTPTAPVNFGDCLYFWIRLHITGPITVRNALTLAHLSFIKY